MDYKSNRIFGNELKYLKEVLETDFRTSAYGLMTDRLEKAFAKKIGGVTHEILVEGIIQTDEKT